MSTPHALLNKWVVTGCFVFLSVLMGLSACSNGGGGDSGTASLALFAGNTDSGGNIDGTGSAARFSGAQAGNIYARFTNPTVTAFEERLACIVDKATARARELDSRYGKR